MAKLRLDKETLRRLDMPTPEDVRLADLDNSSFFKTMLQGAAPREILSHAYRNELNARTVKAG